MLFHKCLMDILDPDIEMDVFKGQLYLVFLPKHLLVGARETYQQIKNTC